MNKSSHYKTLGLFTAAMAFASFAVGCSDSNKSGTLPEASAVTETEEDTAAALSADSLSSKKISASELFSDRDLNPEYDSVDAEITLGGASVKADGKGVTINGSEITIMEEGVYRLSGELNDGQIIVNAKKAKVQLVLDNADIACSYSSAIWVADADKVFLTLAEGSENSLSDGSDYVSEDDSSDMPDAAVFSEDSLTINGTGSLTVSGNCGDGIHSKDDIVITGGKISVTAVGNGIKGKDYTAVADGDITIKSGQDGIKSTNSSDSSLGFIYIEDGKFTIDADSDGIQAETVFSAVGGEFDITSGGGSSNAEPKTGNNFGFGGGGFGGGRDFGGNFGGGFGFDRNNAGNAESTALAAVEFTAAGGSSDDSVSVKGIKAGVELCIDGGVFNISSADDSLHSNQDLIISGGTVNIDAGGKGIHADSQIDITGGTVSITKSYEGIEGAVINVKGGTVEVASSDDGFNASDGSSQGAMGSYANGVQLNISGGTVYVNAEGDGLDSNGDMLISGGTVIVNGPTNGGNGAIDSNNEISVTGGLLIAAGSSGMAEYPGSGSTQYSVSATLGSYSGGTLVTVLDSSGNEILSFAPAKSFENIVISTPELKNGETYTFCTGGTSSSSEQYGLYEAGGYGNDGTEAGSVTISSMTSFIGGQGMMGGGFGGGKGGRGGMNGGRGGFGGMAPSFDGEEPPEMPDGGFGGGMTPPTGSDGRPEMPDGGFDPFGSDSSI